MLRQFQNQKTMKKPTDTKNTATAQALTTPSSSGLSSVVTVRVTYSKEGAIFETNLELNPIASLGLTVDHIVLDAIREITREWSDMVHDSQNVESDHGAKRVVLI